LEEMGKGAKTKGGGAATKKKKHSNHKCHLDHKNN